MEKVLTVTWVKPNGTTYEDDYIVTTEPSLVNGAQLYIYPTNGNKVVYNWKYVVGWFIIVKSDEKVDLEKKK